MFYVATALLFDKNDKLLIYLRDDKPSIPFPNHWDLFGGIIEDGESPEEALRREVLEEIGVELKDIVKFKEYDVSEGDIRPNKKYVFYAKIDYAAENLSLLDVGQMIKSISLDERHEFKFANVLGSIIEEFANSNSVK